MLTLRQNPAFIIEWGHLDYKGNNWNRLVNNNPIYKVVVITRGHSISTKSPNILVINDPHTKETPLYYGKLYYKQIASWCK